MCNVATKFIPLLTAVAVVSSCNSTGSQRKGADELVAQAEAALEARQYDLASQLLDSLTDTYPDRLEAQRTAMHLRPQVLEAKTLAELQTADSLLAYYTHVADSLKSSFTFVNSPDLVEGYYVTTNLAKSNLFSRTGIQGRVTEDGRFYMLSSLTQRLAKHTSVSVSTPGAGEASTATVAFDGDRNYRSGSTEMITFMASECDSVGRWIASHPSAKITLTFKGGSTPYSTTLSADDARSVALAYMLGNAIAQGRRLTIRREMLDRQVMLARDQAARTSEPI